VTFVGLLVALLLASAAGAAEHHITRVQVSNSSTEPSIRFEIDLARAVDNDTRLRVSIDADRNPATGANGIDYALDWTGPNAILLEADGRTVRKSSGGSLSYGGQGETRVSLWVTHPDIASWGSFDFYVFIDRSTAPPQHWSKFPLTAGTTRWRYPDDGDADSFPDTYDHPGESFPAVARARPGVLGNPWAVPTARIARAATSETTFLKFTEPVPLAAGGVLGIGALLGLAFLLSRARAATEAARRGTDATPARASPFRLPEYDRKVWIEGGLLIIPLTLAGLLAALFAGNPNDGEATRPAWEASDLVVTFGTGIWLFVVPGTAIYFERVNSRYRARSPDTQGDRSQGRALAITALVLATLLAGPLALVIDYFAWRRIAASGVRYASGAAVAAVACVAGVIGSILWAMHLAGNL
jgi:hypothetical protein